MHSKQVKKAIGASGLIVRYTKYVNLSPRQEPRDVTDCDMINVKLQPPCQARGPAYHG